VLLEDTLPILGSHIIMQLFTPLVAVLVVTVLMTEVVEEEAVVGQVDLLVAVVQDVIKAMVAVVEEEETPTTDLIK
tara:strand:+ start:290 stop:517 length:228 start_codon:yes stop_codon:yes gene_type:complete